MVKNRRAKRDARARAANRNVAYNQAVRELKLSEDARENLAARIGASAAPLDVVLMETRKLEEANVVLRFALGEASVRLHSLRRRTLEPSTSDPAAPYGAGSGDRKISIEICGGTALAASESDTTLTKALKEQFQKQLDSLARNGRKVGIRVSLRADSPTESSPKDGEAHFNDFSLRISAEEGSDSLSLQLNRMLEASRLTVWPLGDGELWFVEGAQNVALAQLALSLWFEDTGVGAYYWGTKLKSHSGWNWYWETPKEYLHLDEPEQELRWKERHGEPRDPELSSYMDGVLIEALED